MELYSKFIIAVLLGIAAILFGIAFIYGSEAFGLGMLALAAALMYAFCIYEETSY